MAKLPKGMSISYSMVTNDEGNQELTFKYNDTSGINIDKHYEGQDAMKMVDTMYRDVVEDMTKQAHALLEQKKAKEATKQKKTLKKDVEFQTKPKESTQYENALKELQDKIHKLQVENDSLRADNLVLNERLKKQFKEVDKKEQKAISIEELFEKFLGDFSV